MAILVLLVLAILWAAVLLPPILRARSESGMPGGIGEFAESLRSLTRRPGTKGRSGPAPLKTILPPIAPGSLPRIPGAMTQVQRRRRDIFCSLLGVAVFTFLLGLVGSKPMLWFVNVLVDIALGLYVVLLLRFKRRRAERRAKVRAIRRPMHTLVPPLPIDESAPAFGNGVVVPLRRTAVR